MNNRQDFTTFYNLLNKNYDYLQQFALVKKEEMETQLRTLKYEDEYVVVKLNARLKKLTGSNEAIITRSNLAYILIKHISELDINDFLYMPSIITRYNYMIDGKSGKKGDLSFLKIIDNYAYEVKMNINPNVKNNNEYIVHFLKTSKVKKFTKKYLEF